MSQPSTRRLDMHEPRQHGDAGPRHGRLRMWVQMVALGVGSLGAVVAMWSVTDERFAPPPPDPAGWGIWLSQRDAIDAAASISRLAATAALCYLIVTSLLHAAALAWGSDAMSRFTARLSPAPIAAAVSIAVLGGSPLSAAGPVETHSPPGPGTDPVPVMRVVEEGADTPTDVPGTASQTAPAPTTVAPRPTSTTTAITTTPAATTPAATTPTATTPAATGQPDTGIGEPARSPGDTVQRSEASAITGTAHRELVYEVVEGDHLWGIARRWVHLVTGREPDESEIRDYWLALMEANADRMVEPGNPNLLLPGQELVLPS